MTCIRSNPLLTDHYIHHSSKVPTSSMTCKQFRIHEICLALNQFHIRNEPELYSNLDKVMKRICDGPSVFKNFNPSICYQIFTKAVQAYQDILEIKIPLNHKDQLHFFGILNSLRTLSPGPVVHTEKKDQLTMDLGHITRNYDRLETASEKVMQASAKFEEQFRTKDFAIIPHVIFGIGDTGTALWLEKYSWYHRKASRDLSEGKLPEVIIIGQTLGNIRCDYALAQTHSVLKEERLTPILRIISKPKPIKQTPT